MNSYLTDITPDSFSGAVFALEGVRGGLTVLNGPTGCKFYHSATSDNQLIRQLEFDPLNFPAVWYFGQPRIPCTYLDNDDYVYGTEDKLVEALEFMRDNVPFELVSVVNSPGAALIGDDIRGIARRVLGDDVPLVTMETPGYSSDVCHGHEAATLELLQQVELLPPSGGAPDPVSVNLLGMSLFHKNHMGDVAELQRVLELAGIKVNCVLCGGGTLQQTRALRDAALNVVVYPEYGLQTADYLQRQLGMPSYVCPGPPVGFAATERMVKELCQLLGHGCDPQPVIEDSQRARARAYAFVSRVHSLTGMPKAVPYAIEGSCSELCAYIDFLTGYLGMVPDAVQVLNPQSDAWLPQLRQKLESMGLPETLDVSILDTKADLVFGSGNTIAALKLRGHVFGGIETSLPTIGYWDVIPKTHLGVQGALRLTETVLNGLLY